MPRTVTDTDLSGSARTGFQTVAFLVLHIFNFSKRLVAALRLQGFDAREREPLLARMADYVAGHRCVVLLHPDVPQTLRHHLPDAEYRECRSADELARVLDTLEAKVADVVVADARLRERVLGQQEWMQRLAQCCSDRVWWLESPRTDNGEFRRYLHRAGFYEVAAVRPTADTKLEFDYSSVGVLPDGQFQMQASSAARLNNPDYRCLVASRLPMHATEALPWTWVYGEGQIAAMDTVTSAGKNASFLAVQGLPACEVVPTHMRVEARFHWARATQGNSPGALVGAYHGPGDSGMYLAMVGPQPDGSVQISLWHNQSQWVRLAEKTLPEQFCLRTLGMEKTRAGMSMHFYMTLTPRCLSMGTGSVPLLNWDGALNRLNRCYGIRLHGQMLRVGALTATFD
jgi:hypothetical protein